MLHNFTANFRKGDSLLESSLSNCIISLTLELYKGWSPTVSHVTTFCKVCISCRSSGDDLWGRVQGVHISLPWVDMQLSNTTFLPNNLCGLLVLKKKHETRLKNLCCRPLKTVASHVTSSVTYATFLEVPPLLRRKIHPCSRTFLHVRLSTSKVILRL